LLRSGKGCYGNLDLLHPRDIGSVSPSRLAVASGPLQRFDQSEVGAFVIAILLEDPEVVSGR